MKTKNEINRIIRAVRASREGSWTIQSVRLLKAIITALWMFPLMLLFGVLMPRKARRLGYVYRDFVKAVAEV